MEIFKRNMKRGKESICADRYETKKYSDPIRERKREVLGNYIRYGIVFIVWCILIFAAAQVDKEYHSKSGGYFASLVGCFVQLGHMWEINYGLLYDALGGYSSILLTVMGMVVTGWLSLSNRLEKAVYGIRRRELFANGQIGKCLVDSFIGVFSTPAWMTYALIRRYCFTAYFIMGLIFIQFLVSDILLATTYSRNHDYIRLCKKIAHSLKKTAGGEGFGAFDVLLDRIAMSMEENTDWKEVNDLFLSCVGDAGEKEEQELYRISRDFLTIVYAKRNQGRMIDLALSYVQEVSEGYRIGDVEKTKLVYWAVLDCLYQNCTEEELADCMNGLLDMFSLSDVPGDAWTNLPVAWVEEIFAMVALQTEYWLQANDSRQRSFGENFSKIIRLGGAVYASEDRSEKIRRFINVREDVRRETDKMMYYCFDRLKESYPTGEQKRYLGSLLWSVAELYQ